MSKVRWLLIRIKLVDEEMARKIYHKWYCASR